MSSSRTVEDWAKLLREAPKRDPQRIPVILEALRKAWEKEPDQRLMQLLVNALDARPNPLFVIEDKVLLTRLSPCDGKAAWSAGAMPCTLPTGHDGDHLPASPGLSCARKRPSEDVP